MTEVKKSLALVQLSFAPEVKTYFAEIVARIVPKVSLYKSPVKDFIDGDITKNLHVTLIFGLDATVIDNPEFQTLYKSISVNEIQCGNLVLYNRYQSLYKVLCIEILDPKGELEGWAKKLDKYVIDEGSKGRKLKPHLTLAYVNPDYELPEQNLELPRNITVKNLEFVLI